MNEVAHRDGGLGEMVPGPGADTTSCVHPCWVDGQPCEVVALIPKPVEAKHLHLAREYLPCERCRAAEKYAAELPRLGKHERRVLLLASPEDAKESTVVPPPGEGRSADEGNRRAIRKLFGAGLVHAGWKEIKVKPSERARPWFRWRQTVSVWRRSVWLSPLGQAVVNRLGEKLKAGSRIRWAKHRAELISACRETAPVLLSRFLEAIRRRAEWTTMLLGHAKRCGGDPGAIMDEAIAYASIKAACVKVCLPKPDDREV